MGEQILVRLLPGFLASLDVEFFQDVSQAAECLGVSPVEGCQVLYPLREGLTASLYCSRAKSTFP